MPRFQLAIFDLDGTLIDSRPDIAAALNLALLDFGLAARPEPEIEQMIGDGARRLVERAIAGRLPDERTDEVLACYGVHYAANRVVRTRLYPGVVDGLRELGRQGVSLAICTNKPGPLSRAIAADLGLDQLVDEVLGDGDVPTRKPDPAMLNMAMERCGVERKSTLYVGDGPVDVRTAAHAGVPLCLVGWGYRGEETADAKPAYRAETFGDVVRLVAG